MKKVKTNNKEKKLNRHQNIKKKNKRTQKHKNIF